MDIIYWLIPLSILILLLAVGLFFWAIKNGQFDDLDSPATAILFDNDSSMNEKSSSPQNSNSTDKI